MKRVLGVVEGRKQGPLVILLGGLHGNEVAGIKAINEVFHAIHVHRIPVSGMIVGLAGNLQALAKNKRFIDYDLNRCWTGNFIQKIYHKDHTLAEDIELKTLHQTILEFKDSNHPARFLIDLHSTSSEKGNFVVVPGSEAANPVVQRLKQPVVIDLDQHLSGTLLGYLQHLGFMAMAFEGGLIGSSRAIDLHVAGIWEILKASGAIDQDIDGSLIHSGKKLAAYSENRPEFVKVKYHHKISGRDDFMMNPGFVNFQPVTEGEAVARDKRGLVKAPVSGLMFLPLYQTSGDDGFFIVEEIPFLTD